ncbi:MAG: DUF58 domain-containing protein [Paracoccaceae bacterium]|nr:DUF58 domain-containing protein [Paracoccaceae bacterium]MDE2913672.1 DUF58 domain-containing protein [Paracoccaceae bacterium]
MIGRGLGVREQTILADRQEAESLADGLPPLLARARQLAALLSLGVHGRRRSGVGEEFWQYRPAVTGDRLHQIDWRKSARSDEHFLRQMEWQTSQSVTFWIDLSQSMRYRSRKVADSKGDRARLLGLALSVLLSRAGERFGLFDDPEPTKSGETQLVRTGLLLLESGESDYGIPPERELREGSMAVFLSDFLGDWDRLETSLLRTAGQRVNGHLMQILDPSESEFPFDGRRIFESMGGTLRFETLRAAALREDYQKRLEDRQASLRSLADRLGWRVSVHSTADSPLPALLWLYVALETGT